MCRLWRSLFVVPATACAAVLAANEMRGVELGPHGDVVLGSPALMRRDESRRKVAEEVDAASTIQEGDEAASKIGAAISLTTPKPKNKQSSYIGCYADDEPACSVTSACPEGNIPCCKRDLPVYVGTGFNTTGCEAKCLYPTETLCTNGNEQAGCSYRYMALSNTGCYCGNTYNSAGEEPLENSECAPACDLLVEDSEDPGQPCGSAVSNAIYDLQPQAAAARNRDVVYELQQSQGEEVCQGAGGEVKPDKSDWEGTVEEAQAMCDALDCSAFNMEQVPAGSKAPATFWKGKVEMVSADQASGGAPRLCYLAARYPFGNCYEVQGCEAYEAVQHRVGDEPITFDKPVNFVGCGVRACEGVYTFQGANIFNESNKWINKGLLTNETCENITGKEPILRDSATGKIYMVEVIHYGPTTSTTTSTTMYMIASTMTTTTTEPPPSPDAPSGRACVCDPKKKPMCSGNCTIPGR